MVEFWKKIIEECSNDLPMDVKNLPNVGFKIFISVQRMIQKLSKAIKHMLFWF